MGKLFVPFIYKLNFEKWNIFAFVFASFPLTLLQESDLFIEQFKNERQRFNFLFIFVLLPILSFTSAKQNAENIKNNKKINYIVNSSQDTKQITKKDTLKIVGNSESFYFLSDLNNTKIIQVKTDKMDTIVIYKKE